MLELAWYRQGADTPPRSAPSGATLCPTRDSRVFDRDTSFSRYYPNEEAVFHRSGDRTGSRLKRLLREPQMNDLMANYLLIRYFGSISRDRNMQCLTPSN